jgi:hypothetical protein
MYLAEIGISRKVLLGEERKFTLNFARRPSCESNYMYRDTSYSHWQLGTLQPLMRTAPAGAFVLHHTKIGKGAMKKFEICSQCGAVNLF